MREPSGSTPRASAGAMEGYCAQLALDGDCEVHRRGAPGRGRRRLGERLDDLGIPSFVQG
ncbi:MAG: hypothetical protein HKN46_06895 [Acidimicrobiia bacterium]|nr:hypothetical protein [Acidimicrobiia bacterium]